MKRISALILGLIITTGILTAAVQKPTLPPPPCKYAGQYFGVITPTSWAKNTVTSELKRQTIWLTVNEDYTDKFQAYAFDGTKAGSISGTLPIPVKSSVKVTSLDPVTKLPNGLVLSVTFKSRGIVSGSYVDTITKERGVFTLYRENVLP